MAEPQVTTDVVQDVLPKGFPAKIRTDFVNGTPLIGPPATAFKDFERPQLRRYPASAEDIKWLCYLGHGEEGHVYKGNIGDQGPFAIKAFWHTYQHFEQRTRWRGGKLESYNRPLTFPFKTESRNNDLVQKLQQSISEAQGHTKQNITIKPAPKTRHEAILNLQAFSKEAQESPPRPGDDRTEPPPPLPPFPRCYGWLLIKNSLLPSVYPTMHRKPDPIGYSWAIVYEYIPKAEPNTSVAQTFFDFFYQIGFTWDFQGRNWSGGRLLDMNDFSSALKREWSPHGACLQLAEKSNWMDETENTTVRCIKVKPF